MKYNSVSTLQKLTSFSECAELIKDTFIPSEDVVPYIGLEHIGKNSLRLISVGQSSDIISQKFKFKKDDILFGKLRPYFRKVIRPDFDGICSTDIFVIRAKKGFSQSYLYYLVASEEFVNYASRPSEGTRMPRAKWDFLEKFEKNIPNIRTQQKIGKILSNLDLKIDNLRKQNQTLEDVSKTIFKSWFIAYDRTTEFKSSELGKIPKDWKIIKLENFFKITKGVSYRSQDLIFSNKALVTLKSINRGGGYTSKGLKSFDGKYNADQIVNEFDIVIAQTDLTQSADVLGTPAIIRKSFDFNTLIASLDLVIIKLKNGILPKSYLYHLLLTTEFHNYILGYKNGTTVLHLESDGILNYTCVIPTEKILKEFDKLVSCIITKNHKNNYEIEILTKIRDVLLPKLMSGKLQVHKKSDSK